MNDKLYELIREESKELKARIYDLEKKLETFRSELGMLATKVTLLVGAAMFIGKEVIEAIIK